MNRRMRYVLRIILGTAVMATALPVIPLPNGRADEAPWSTYRGNNRRTGNTDGKNGPLAKPELLWAMKSDAHFVASPVPVNDGLVVSGVGAFNKPDILNISTVPADPKAVKPRWMKSAPFLKLPTVSSPVTTDNRLLFGDGMHQTDGAILYCLPADGGYLLWSYAVPGNLVHMEGSPAIADRRVFVGAGTGGVICVDLDKVTLNGKTLDVKEIPALQAARWKELQAEYEADKKKDPDFAIPPSEDKLLKPIPQLHWHQGKGRWHVDAPMLVVGNKLLCGSAFLDKEKMGDRAIFCLDTATGKELWKAPLNFNPWGGSAVVGDTVIVTTSSIAFDTKALEGAKGEIIALDLATGKERWKKNVPGGALGCAALTADSAVFTATDGKLRIFSIKDGSRMAIYDAKAALFAPPAIVGETAYLADLAGVVHAVDLKTGNARWTMDLGKDPVKLPGMNYGGITVHGGKLFLATCNLEGPFVKQPTAVFCIGGQ